MKLQTQLEEDFEALRCKDSTDDEDVNNQEGMSGRKIKRKLEARYIKKLPGNTCFIVPKNYKIIPNITTTGKIANQMYISDK